MFLVEEFFPDYKMEANSSYFVVACNDLNDIQKAQVKEEFAKMLTHEGICKKRSMPGDIIQFNTKDNHCRSYGSYL